MDKDGVSLWDGLDFLSDEDQDSLAKLCKAHTRTPRDQIRHLIRKGTWS